MDYVLFQDPDVRRVIGSKSNDIDEQDPHLRDLADLRPVGEMHRLLLVYQVDTAGLKTCSSHDIHLVYRPKDGILDGMVKYNIKAYQVFL